MPFLRGFCVVAGLLAFLVSYQASAQPLFTKPVRLISPNPPGSASDTLLRGMAEVLSKEYGQPFVVENRPGASGSIGVQVCANAPADGHTFCLLDAFNVVLSPAIYRTMPVDTRNDLVPVVLMGFFPAGLWLNRNVAANSVAELFELAKKSPGKLNFGSFGPASSSAIYIAWLKKVRGVDFTNIPYKSALDAFRAAVTGEVDVVSYALEAARSNSAPGDVKLLAVNNPSRLTEYPDVPTFTEVGIDGVLAWFGLFAPRGTPQAVIERVNASVVKGLIDGPEAQKKIMDIAGIVPSAPAAGTPESFSKFVGTELGVYEKLVKDAGIEKID